MTIKVLIVDDSTFICKQIKRILEEDPQFTVVGVAVNGREAVIKAAALEPDVITMDVEMPVMDGITAVKKIMAETPTPILMFSATTQVGAKSALDALNAGAIDFLPKQLEDIDGNLDRAKQQLRQRVRMVAQSSCSKRDQSDDRTAKSVVSKPDAGIQDIIKPAKSLEASNAFRAKINAVSLDLEGTKSFPMNAQVRNSPFARLKLMVVVASTGGPVAIQQILMHIPEQCPVPILIVQHMPANFTRSFAERLDSVCRIRVKEAAHSDILEPGKALLAPGGMQLEIRSSSGRCWVELHSKSPADIYAPCADITLSSVAKHLPGQTLTIVLTGMGADGKEGALKLKQGGAKVWAQNEASCTIYGMPKAIVDANLADKVYALTEIANEFKRIAE